MSASHPPGGPHRRAKERLLWLSRRVNKGGLQHCLETMTLVHLEDSRRPLLFSLLRRMLRPESSTTGLLQRALGYVEETLDRAPAMIVASRRWNRALSTSRELAARLRRSRKP